MMQIRIVVGKHRVKSTMLGMKKLKSSPPTVACNNGIIKELLKPAAPPMMPAARPTTFPAIKVGKKLNEIPNKKLR